MFLSVVRGTFAPGEPQVRKFYEKLKINLIFHKIAKNFVHNFCGNI